ncbi:DUF993 family protein [Curtobacterium aurantiacum]|uniref:DUF993 family protein n=1 Tax=Curtobacterium aurantiacum TaxID=3236919 RepID=A0ABS5VKC2_9MICO|nr:DUF993 family protein [Curtobacterium flaccumfaciens]MBT1546607.1 DUF993 family protein [Curtobacterium flaccumfaciens pv. flaccumfaciens]MBT1589341.1 DUF993 family protein [Curtobacterium flaccumfaciens pv. flaccumfaciens]
MTDLTLLAVDGTTSRAPLGEPAVDDTAKPTAPLTERVVYAAAHVVPRTAADNTPGAPADLDWDATLAFRHHLWSWGLGVADAMDTAQRNMGLDPAATRELVTRSAREAQSVGGRIVVGVNTDDLPDEPVTEQQIADAYVRQLHHAEDAGAGVVLMASRHLARLALDDPATYRRVHGRVLERAGAPVVLHWLGEAFDPALAGYFGGHQGPDTVLDIMRDAGPKVSGIKMSLLDASAEVALRARLPETARMFTGDDFHYVDLIAGQDGVHSDALLGAFAAIAPLASAAVRALPDESAYRALLGPTEALSRHLFSAPTWHYKTGIAFLAWLNGHQPAFAMVGGQHAGRSLPHLSETVRLANACGALQDPDLAAERWHAVLAVNGVETTAGRPAPPAADRTVAGVVA